LLLIAETNEMEDILSDLVSITRSEKEKKKTSELILTEFSFGLREELKLVIE